MQRTLVSVGVHPDALDSELAARANDANGDFSAVRNQEAPDHRVDQLGDRFSRNARRPSWPSADTRRAASAVAVIDDAYSTVSSQTCGINEIGRASCRERG